MSHLVIVAPSGGGHHPEYVRWIARGATARGVSVTVAGPTELVAQRDRLASSIGALHTLVLPELDALGEGPSLWEIGRRTGAAIRRAVEATAPSDVLLTYLDHAQLALAAGLRFVSPVRISGILFRATLHEPTPTGLAPHLREIRKHALLRLAARNRHLHRVLTLDPDAVPALRALGMPATYLPDPVAPSQPTSDRAAVRDAYGIEPHRQLAVLFGSLEERKGLLELAAALPLLPSDAAERLAIAIVGQSYDAVRPRLEAALAQAQERTRVQVVYQERFVPDGELADLTAAADLVLAPYRGHVGSSGVLLRAAAAGTPVLGPDAGLMHREVVRHRLGVTADTAAPRAIADALVRALHGEGFDGDAAAAYADAHSVERFAEVLFDTLGMPEGQA